MSIAKTLEVARGGGNTLQINELPIILVPGIMGSRIHEAGQPSKTIWDPDDTWAMLRLADLMTAYRQELFDVTTRAEVFKKGYSKTTLTADQEDRGWGGLAWGFYGKGLESLEQRSRDLGGIVYGFGYDWRVSNWLNGEKLQKRIQKVRKAHDGKKVLLVTHSMGGLVSRAACAQGASPDVLGVVHTMQPANGTPLAYRQFKTGGKALHWVLADVVLGRIVGRTPIQYAAVISGTRAPFELLPNKHHYRATGREANEPPGRHSRRDPWLTYDAKIKSSLGPSSTAYDAYREEMGRVGLIDYRYFGDHKTIAITEGYIIAHMIDGPRIRDGVLTGVNEAEKFHHERLNSSVHPNTAVLAGNGLETDVATHMVHDWNLFTEDSADPTMIRGDHGDGTVALSSSTALPLSSFAEARVADTDRQRIIEGVQHAAAFGTSAEFNEIVWDLCEQAVLCGSES